MDPSQLDGGHRPLRIALTDAAEMTFGGGYEIFLLGAAKNFTRAGHRVDIVSPGRRAANAISWAVSGRPLATVLSDDQVTKRAGGAQLHAGISRRGIARLRTADVIYCKNEPQEIAFVRVVAKRRTPIIVGWHSAPRSEDRMTSSFRNRIYTSRFYRWLLGGTHAVHLLHESQLDFLREIGYDPARTFVVGNGIHPQTQVSQRQPGSTFQVLFVGRLLIQKGVDLLIRAMEELVAEDIALTIVGEGVLAPDVIAATERLPNLRYVGYLPDVSPAYAGADLLVAPSRWETFSLVSLEALCAGLTVAVSDGPGLEAVRSVGVSTFAAGDVTSLASLIRAAHRSWREDRAGWDRRRSELQARALELFDADQQYSQLLSHLSDVAGIST